MDKSNALDALDALSHDTRLDLFRLLVRAGRSGLAAGDAAERLALRQNTASTNLAILARAGLVQSRREGRNIIYAANFDTMRGLVGFLMKDCCAGAPAKVDPLLDQITANQGETP